MTVLLLSFDFFTLVIYRPYIYYVKIKHIYVLFNTITIVALAFILGIFFLSGSNKTPVLAL